MDPVQEVQVGQGEDQTSDVITPETVSNASNPAPIAIASETKETLINSENSEKTLMAPESVSSDQPEGLQPVDTIASLPVEQSVPVVASETATNANPEDKPEDSALPVQPPSTSEIIVVEDHQQYSQQQQNIATITLDDDVTIIPPETITIDLESDTTATPCASQSDANPSQSSSSVTMEVVEISDSDRVNEQPNPSSIAVGDNGIIVIPDEVITIDSTGDTITDTIPSQTTADTAMDIAPEESTTSTQNIEQPPSIAVDNATIVIPDDVLDVAQTEAVLTSSLALIAGYGMSDNDDDDDSDSSSEDESSSSSSSSSSDEDEVKLVDTVSYRNTVNVLSSGGESGDSDVELVGTEEKKRPKKIIKAKGEMDVIDLPPIEDLNISVPAHECIELGKVMSVVDQLVLVESHPGNIALDIDTVLFLDNGNRALGRIFDVLGQVNQPIYCVRFNSAEHIQEKDILNGMKVFYNNKSEEHTSVVCLPNLLRMKGSDASWDHDIEPPQGCIEYSDDEEERTARKARKQAGQKAIPEDPTNQRMKRVRPTTSTGDRAGGPPNRQARVRNPFGGPRFSHPPPNVQGNHNANQSQQSWNNNNNNNNNNHQMNTNHSNQWPQQTQPGYGNDYSNYSWHTYYQQQQQGPHAYAPPPGMPPGMPPFGGMPRGPPPGPFYANPYAQPGPGGPLPPPPVNMQHPPPQPQWVNNNGNYYQNSGGPGPSQGGSYYQQERR